MQRERTLPPTDFFSGLLGRRSFRPLEALEAYGVRYVVIGGIAAIAQGYSPRPTST